MSILDCKKENVDNISKIWLPDNAACLAAEEKRQEEEWLRKKNGLNGKRPSELGIDNYIYGQPLHPKFYEGRTPPQVPIDSMENLEWYADQLHRAIYGFEYNGQRITGDHYWFLNFFPFLVAKKDKRGRPTKDFEINFPYYSVIHDYVFKVIEQAHFEGKGIAWMAGRGVGKQQPDSEVVITPEGKRPMGDIRPGDMVIGSKGKPIKVLEIHPQGVDDVYEVELKDGRIIRCGLEHLWNVKDSHGREKTLELKDLLIDYKKVRSDGRIDNKYFIPTGKGADYDHKDLFINPYLMGALLGDGSFDKYGTRLIVAEGEEEIRENVISLQNLTSNDFSDNDEKLLDKVHNRMFFKKSSGITKECVSLGLAETSTLTKFIPDVYKIGSREQRMELLRGLLDTDGYCSKIGSIEFSSNSKQLATDTLELSRSLGIKSSMSEGVRKGRNLEYRVRLYTGDDVFRLGRKLSLINRTPNKAQQNHRDLTAIVDIRKMDYKEHSTCLTVDADDCLYLTTDYTVTHNTYIILSILAKIYHLKPTSHCYVSASQPRHADEAFSKLTLGLDSIAEVHPTLALNRLIDTKSFIESGQEVVRDGVKTKEGPRSKIQKIVYGDNPGITRGSRPDAQLIYQLRINYVNCWKPLKLNELQRNQKW